MVCSLGTLKKMIFLSHISNYLIICFHTKQHTRTTNCQTTTINCTRPFAPPIVQVCPTLWFLWLLALSQYSYLCSSNQTGVVMKRGIWWAKKEIIKVSGTENYLWLIPVHHQPSFVVTTVKTGPAASDFLLMALYRNNSVDRNCCLAEGRKDLRWAIVYRPIVQSCGPIY